jgi:hypothetical protein
MLPKLYEIENNKPDQKSVTNKPQLLSTMMNFNSNGFSSNI